jgi:DDE family transposase
MPRYRLSKAIISQLQGFTQTLGEACPKPSRKFLYQMTLGLALSGSVLLSEVARKLLPLKSITFHALHKGLCRGLKSRQWSALPAQERYLKQAKRLLPSNAIIACDLGDITKPRARKMPGLRKVRDGSTGQIKKGWWLIEIEAIFGKKGQRLPLWLELFSVGRRGYKSQRAMIEMAITTMVRHLGKLGLWVFDRGFDSWEFFEFLDKTQLKFLVRAEGRRLVRDLSDGQERSLAKMTQQLPSCGTFLWGRRRQGRGYLIRVGFGALLIAQTGQMLWVVVARGFGRKPMLLLTNQSITCAEQAIRLIKTYLKRWAVEEAGRLVKQVFRLENLRVLTWPGLVKLVWLVLWAYGMMCFIRIKAKRLFREMIKAYPAFGPVPHYPYYRIAGALAWVLLVALATQTSPPPLALKSG